MDETIKEVYTSMLYLKNKGELNAGGIYSYIDNNWRNGSDWFSKGDVFIRKYFNSNQDGFNLYLDRYF